jgi:uncharacterized membrane protein YhaH (DUF805 family)
MVRVQRFFFWCCLVAGGVMLCIFAIGIIVGIMTNKPIPILVYALAGLFALIAVTGRAGLKSTLPEEN